VSIFLFILLNNFLGLFPYIFTASRHLSFTFVLALSIWLGYILFSILKNINRFLSHLVPLGTPYPLMPFIVIIELIRNIIRPLTLSVRLAANIVAGHLLIVLIRTPLVIVSHTIFIFIF
jgi:F-type H+-transporting ATPase subunit a